MAAAHEALLHVEPLLVALRIRMIEYPLKDQLMLAFLRFDLWISFTLLTVFTIYIMQHHSLIRRLS